MGLLTQLDLCVDLNFLWNHQFWKKWCRILAGQATCHEQATTLQRIMEKSLWFSGLGLSWHRVAYFTALTVMRSHFFHVQACIFLDVDWLWAEMEAASEIYLASLSYRWIRVHGGCLWWRFWNNLGKALSFFQSWWLTARHRSALLEIRSK